MSRLASIAFLASLACFPKPGLAATPVQPGLDRRGEPAAKTEPDRPSDARFALFRSEPGSALLVAELADARIVAPQELAALRDEFRTGRTPTRNGFLRELPPGLTVDLAHRTGDVSATAPAPGLLFVTGAGGETWAGDFRAVGAWALRIRLANVRVPEGTRFVVCGDGQADCTAFGTEAIADRGEIWSPIVEGDRLHLEVTIPPTSSGSGGGFVPAGLLELVSAERLEAAPVRGSGAAALDTSCLVNGECASDADLADLSKYRSGYAHLQFVKDGANYICSGALVNADGVEGFIPYLLTANHCFDTQASASSLVAYFDYRYASCSGGTPFLSTLPRVAGASLLATNPSSDFTFLRLSANPPGFRFYFGWEPRGIAPGATLYRLSHPGGWPQSFSVSQYVSSPSPSCSSFPPGRFAYSSPIRGATAGGSSGAPVILPGGYIVGQLYGRCGTGDATNPCDTTNAAVDGSFATTWPLVSQWLRPSSAASKPAPDFGFAPSAPRVGESVQFTDVCSGAPTSWSWDFGDGSRSAQENPAHAFSTAGTFNVSLAASNAAGSASTSRTIHVTALPVPPAYGNTWVVPSAARVAGAGGEFWTTDLTVMNSGAAPIDVNLKFLGHGDDGLAGPERTFALGPLSSLVIPDVLGSEFGLTADWGPILLRTVTGSVVAQAQTSTPGNGGTYGQSVPAIPRAAAIGTTTRAICGIRQDEGFRTNVVLVNLAEQTAQVDLVLVSPTGLALAALQEEIGPLGFRQLNVGSDLGVSDVVGATLLLSTKSPLTPFAAYASVIDNRTADPRTLLPQ